MNEILRVLLVDDDEVDRLTIRRLLRTAGFKVEWVEARDGSAALACLREQGFDAVLLDFHMPGHDGLWVLRQLRATSQSLPVIMLTGQGGEQTAVELMKAGATDYLPKAGLSTERLEQRLRQAIRLHLAEQQHRVLAEALPQLVWTATPNGQPDYHNQRWLEDIGIAGEPLRDLQVWRTVLHPEDVPRCFESWWKAVNTGQPFEAECRFRHASDGTWRWYLSRAMPLRDARGRILKWFGTCTDIDDQKRAAEALSFLAEASSTLTASLDRSATLERLTALLIPRLGNWCAIHLLEDGERLQQAAVAHADPTLTPLLKEPHRQNPLPADCPHGYPGVLRTGRAELLPEVPEEVARQVVPGLDSPSLLPRLQPTSWLVVPLRVQQRVFGALTVCATQAGLRYTQRELQLTQELASRAEVALDNARLFEMARLEHQRAEHANRSKDEFLAIISHELRTPLSAIIGWTRMLRSGHLSPEKQARALETVERNASVQTQLIEDLLDISRIITGKVRLDIQPLEPIRFIEAAMDSVRPAAEAKGVHLRSQLETDTCLIPGDTDRLQQVVWNLLSNAIKFTSSGGWVCVRLRRTDTRAVIEVGDNGQGIPSDFLPHIFERFRQADSSSTRRHGGLGLGLAIVRHITELHGGTIRAWSEGEGRGALFTLELPLAKACQEPHPPFAPGPSLSPGSAPATPMEMPGLRVLVVDDEPDARELLVTVLEACKAQVATASSTPEALEVLRTFQPHVVVSDVGMPGEDGYTFIRRLRALPREQGGQIPAIALTAFTRMEDRTRALLAGFQTHVPKPVEPAELIIVLATLTRPLIRG